MQELQKPRQGYKVVKSYFGKYEEIPEEWELQQLPAIAELIMGQSPPGDSYNFNRIGTPLLNGPTEFGIEHPFPIQFTTAPTKLSQKEDILLCVRGSTTGRLNLADQEYCLGRGLASIRGLRGKTDTKWLYYQFLRLQKKIYNIASGGGTTFPNINSESIKKLLIPYPPLEEQKRISLILSKIDELIQKIDQIIEQTQRLKKGLMQILMTKGIGHTKFKRFIIGPRYLQAEIPSKWSVLKLEVIISQSISYGVLVPEEDPNGVPMIRAGEIDSPGGIERNILYISKSLEEKYRKTRLQGGEILLVVVGSVGQLTIAPQSCKGFNVNRQLAVIRLRPGYLPEFYAYLLRTINFQKKIRTFTSGSVQPALTLGQVSKFKVPVPEISEQRRIVDILSKMDSRIQRAYDYYLCLLKMKSGLMQKLLTGKIRVNV
jgi:type I restriction enzyme S subunit